MAIGMQHPKVSLYIGDGLEYLQNNKDTYDVIIADLSDPDGKNNLDIYSVFLVLSLPQAKMK